MKQEINEYDFERAFKQMDRDNYSWEGYQALYNYYDEFEDFSLDVIAVCCEVSEYTEEEVLKSYDYAIEREEGQTDEEYLETLVDYLEGQTYVIKLDNGSFLVWDY